MARMGLNTARVVAAAIELVDSAGFDALSLAALAQKLGIRVPSLYKHIQGIDDLRIRLSNNSRTEVYEWLTIAAEGKEGYERFRAIASAYRQYAQEHPGRFDAAGWKAQLVTAPSIGPLIADMIRQCGVPEEQVVVTGYAIRAALRGYLSLSSATPPGETPDSIFTALLSLLENGMRAVAV